MPEVIINTAKLDETLNLLIARLTNREPLMRRIAGDMADAVEQNFEQQGRPAWESLKPSTIKARTKKGHWPGRILQVSGSLAASISQQSDENSATVGTNKAYAAIHQFGGTIHRYAQSRLGRQAFKKTKKGQVRFAKEKAKGAFSTLKRTTIGAYNIDIPARPFLTLTEEDMRRIEQTAQAYLEEPKSGS